MPLVRIALKDGRPQAWREAIAEGVHRAMVETIGVPPQDRFQIITQHSPQDLVFDPQYLGIPRTDDIVVIQITLNTGRTVEQKKTLYARIAELLCVDPGLRKEDIFVNLVEVPKENWSFGNGEAQYA